MSFLSLERDIEEIKTGRKWEKFPPFLNRLLACMTLNPKSLSLLSPFLFVSVNPSLSPSISQIKGLKTMFTFPPSLPICQFFRSSFFLYLFFIFYLTSTIRCQQILFWKNLQSPRPLMDELICSITSILHQPHASLFLVPT